MLRENILLRYLILMVVLIVYLPFAAPCGAVGVSPKSTSLRVKNVEIRGTEVRLPIPDGYEEMRREDAPETYDWLLERGSGEDRLPLAYFICSEDKALLKQGHTSVDLRYGVAFSEDIYWDDIIGDELLEYFKTTMKKYSEYITKRVDENIKKKNRIPMLRSLLHEGKKSISFLSVTREKQPAKFFPGAIHSKSYIVVDKKIVEVILWRDAFNEPEVQSIRQDVLGYLKKIDNDNY